MLFNIILAINAFLFGASTTLAATTSHSWGWAVVGLVAVSFLFYSKEVFE